MIIHESFRVGCVDDRDHFVRGRQKSLNDFMDELKTSERQPTTNSQLLSTNLTLPPNDFMVELDRYIANPHHRGRLWDNRYHRQMMTIGDQCVPMFHDDVTP